MSRTLKDFIGWLRKESKHADLDTIHQISFDGEDIIALLTELEVWIMKIPYFDASDLDEDERIRQIGEVAMNERKVVGFITDSDEGRADRYIQKLKEKFPGIRITGRGNGPVPGTVWVRVEPPLV